MSEWRSIETAPNDATDILCYFPTLVEYCLGMSPGIEVARRIGMKEWSTWGFSTNHQPTHWMPLPSPPDKDSRQ